MSRIRSIGTALTSAVALPATYMAKVHHDENQKSHKESQMRSEEMHKERMALQTAQMSQLKEQNDLPLGAIQALGGLFKPSEMNHSEIKAEKDEVPKENFRVGISEAIFED